MENGAEENSNGFLAIFIFLFSVRLQNHSNENELKKVWKKHRENQVVQVS